ncbi:hypothetical protein [Burkholderia sp. BCC1972]|uniref:hypothetical protein n=1 Tax=Burkholderia sp. BCC1972 TaxID=2817438 RepID=UPI002ABE1B6A|nr:hypothetical protein [Burkholderia sp. BCC1972]
MHLITTRDATRLTGLSTEQLREWTSRRALILPDVKPKGHGSPARFSWQTILLLRVAVVLRDRFKLELHAHRDVFSALAVSLSRMSFLSLWGKSLVLYGDNQWAIVDPREEDSIVEDCIMLRMDPHLQQLSDCFSLPKPAASGQFQLFPAVGVMADATVNGTTGRRRHG